MKKSIRYIDIHGHINFPEYDSDREDVIRRATHAGIGIITVGTDTAGSRRAIEIAENHENIWAIVGIHPDEIKSETAGSQSSGFQDLRRLALHPKVVAIGECGLDYFHSKPSDIPAQIDAFEKHIAIANDLKKPLMLHVRNDSPRKNRINFGDQSISKNDSIAAEDMATPARNAYADALDILKKSAKVPFNFHFFAGSMHDMQNIFVQGGTVSFTGVITFAHDYDGLIKTAPLEKIMSETDCPYVAPVPYRGKRSEPLHVTEVVKTIARIRGEDEEKIRLALLENARRFFSLP